MGTVMTRDLVTRYRSDLESLMRSVEDSISDMDSAISEADEYTLRHFPYIEGIASEDYRGLMTRFCASLVDLDRLRSKVVEARKRHGMAVTLGCYTVDEPVRRSIETFKNLAPWAKE